MVRWKNLSLDRELEPRVRLLIITVQKILQLCLRVSSRLSLLLTKNTKQICLGPQNQTTNQLELLHYPEYDLVVEVTVLMEGEII